jgi:hypothetical protein
MALGVSQFDGRNDPSAVSAFASKVGHKPATWTLWSTWGDPSSKAFPKTMAQSLVGMGVTPMVWWEPMRVRGSCDFARHKLIANGRYDRYIKKWARDAKSVGDTVLVRWAQEINGNYFPWAAGQCGNKAATYRDAWRHIVRLFRNVGARNVKFVWTVSNKPKCKPTPCNPYKAFFPGSSYIDFAGYSSFNWGSYDGTWVSMADGIRKSYKAMRQLTKKPIIIVELATNTGSGSKPDWIRDGYPAVYDQYPAVKGVNWFNVNLSGTHADWSLNSSQAVDAYHDIVAQTRFQGGY